MERVRGVGGTPGREPGAATAGAPGSRVRALAGSAHPGPALAVTVLAGLLAAALVPQPWRAVAVVVAVAAGQLSIGWSNDLLDADRDRAVGRTDKPLAAGDRGLRGSVRAALVFALVVCAAASFAVGVAAGLAHLVVVAAGWAYNLGLKATWWSWAPYAVAFGLLPVFVKLAARPVVAPTWWLPAAGALLGVGAHLVNVLPDLDDDAATGVRGFPHRLGAGRAMVAAVVVLAAATVIVLVGATGLGMVAKVVAALLVALALVAAVAVGGRTAFRAAVVVALVDAVLLVVGAA